MSKNKNNFFYSIIVFLSGTFVLTLPLVSHAAPKEKPEPKNKVDIIEATNLYIVNVLDPYANVNKVLSKFNAHFFRIIGPGSDLYNSDGATPVRWPLNAAAKTLDNVRELGVGTASNALVGNFEGALTSIERFLINAIALGGIIPLADTLAQEPEKDLHSLKDMPLSRKIMRPLRLGITSLRKPQVTSFTHVLDKWGMGCGVYVVFPFLGGDTTRSILGKTAEMPLQPENYIAPVLFVRIAGSIAFQKKKPG